MYRTKEYGRDNFVRFLIDGKREFTEDEIEIRKQILDLEWLVPSFLVISISPNYSNVPYADRDRMLEKYESYVNKLLEKYGVRSYCLTNSCNNVNGLITLGNSNLETEKLNEILVQIRLKLQTSFGLEVFIGVGSVVDCFGKIHVSASEAHEMLGYKYQYAEQGVINVLNLVQFQCNISGGNGIEFERVIGCFQDGNLGKMELRINELVEFVRNRPNVSKTSIRRTLVELTVHILHVASNANVDVEQVLKGVDPYRWIMRQNRTEIITEWIMKMSSDLLLLIHDRKQNEEKIVVQQAKQYINDNLTNTELGLLCVSKAVGLSSTYFSQLFKQEVGMGLSNYIVQSRIQRAQILLENTDLKSAEISRQIGFASPGYFGQVFRKNVGSTPNEYRRKYREYNKKIT